ncbi:methyl-accepting chemotaxis protein [Iodobacter ciconiae]|uniref:Methyl-accepting chemotaxis protein n=1 Tax=Iodobacter ciconiae TaxID=2496266 RepID=A0A3S8ZRE4_9NEIS|nr:methyl-accepting chemotaxis protein [Iodobacter ciconiae]AZN36059.1 methyl-accepting chemotaxis protein [Iodobacter ciconiae]
MSLRLRLIIMSALGIIAMLITSLIGLYGIYQANQTINSIYQDRVVPLRDLKNVADFYAVNIVDTSHKVRNGSLSAEKGASLINEAEAGITRDWGHYMASSMVEKESKLANENEQLMKRASQISNKLKQAIKNKDTAALDQLVIREMYPAIEPVSDKISELITLQLDVAKQDHEASEQAYLATRAFNIVLLVVIALILITISAWLIRDISHAVRSTTQFADVIASGDLSKDKPSASKDELGTLLNKLGEMQKSLRSAVQEIAKSSTAIGSASSELSQGSKQTSAAIDLQNQASASLASSVEEMTVSVSIITDNSEDVSSSTDIALATTHTSGQVIQATQAALSQMSCTIGTATQRILQLQDRSNAVGQIARVIRDIADQTNLLALNAAIEAARAGDMGRGFAVVADEVRKLAERTTQSTLEINETINAIQTGTTEAATIMNQALSEVQIGVQHAGDAAASVQSSHNAARSVHTAIHAIVDSLREQRQVCNLISQNIERIAQASEENNLAVHANVNTAFELDQQVLTLQTVVARFNL